MMVLRPAVGMVGGRLSAKALRDEGRGTGGRVGSVPVEVAAGERSATECL